ncbi:MAG: hypothetical protein AAF557_26265 [Pseudomonadota bacterium]
MNIPNKTQINEWDIGHWIRRGELRLEHIIQAALGADEITATALIDNIEPMRGTTDAGVRAAKFAAAMQETYAAPGVGPRM